MALFRITHTVSGEAPDLIKVSFADHSSIFTALKHSTHMRNGLNQFQTAWSKN